MKFKMTLSIAAIPFGIIAMSAMFNNVSAANIKTAAEEGLMAGFPANTEKIVNAKNWLKPPYNRWSFQHIESVSPTRTIYKGSSTRTLDWADAETIARYEQAMGEGGFDLQGYIHDNYVDGVIVLKDGKIVGEHYANGQTLDTRHIMFSVGKSFTGVLAELLIHEGVLDERKLVSAYVPELKDSGYGDATVRQVMDMLVSLDYSEDYADPMSDINQFIYTAGLSEAPEGVTVMDSLYEFLPTLKKKGLHGEKWQYVTGTTEVLGWIMSRASGESWGQLLESRIYRHLGFRRDAHIIVDGKGKSVAAGGLSMTLRDVARFAQLVANDGEWDGKQVIPAVVVQKIKAGGDPEKFESMTSTGVQSYKSQWYIDHSKKQLSGYGIHGQAIQIGTESGIVIVTQSSWPKAEGPLLWYRRSAFKDAVYDALSDNDPAH